MIKTIQMTYKDIININNEFQSDLFQKLFYEPLTLNLGLCLKDIVDFIENKLNDYNTERLEIIKVHADKDEEGNVVFDKTNQTILVSDIEKRAVVSDELNKLENSPRNFNIPSIPNQIIESVSESKLPVLSVYHLKVLNKFLG